MSGNLDHGCIREHNSHLPGKSKAAQEAIISRLMIGSVSV
jgi:hypothetical protein